MNKIKRGMELLRGNGMRAIYHAALMKLKGREKEQTKYDKWIQRFEYQMPIEKADGNAGISVPLICADENMWENIQKEQGDFLAFYCKGDSLNKDWKAIVTAYIQRHKNVKFFYTDEDFFANGKRCNPVFKPEWSPDTYLSYDYIGGLLVIERNLALQAISVMSAMGDLENRYGNGRLYALGLCATEHISAEEIGHLKRVLYHREVRYKISKDSLFNIKNDCIFRRKLNAVASYEEKTGEVRVVFSVPTMTKVSIIIPSKEQSDILETCLKSAEMFTDYQDFEWIIVDNGSSDEQRRRYEELAQDVKHPYKYIYEKMDFNFAKMCNIGAVNATGQCLVFLNDDIEFTEKSKGWLEKLAGQAMQAHTGAVGAKLLYPGTTLIQHIGVVNYARGAAHILNQSDDRKILPFNRNCLDINMSMVTGALLAVNRAKFDEVQGFCEELKVTYNDVDLCLKLLEAGYYNVLRSDVVAYHHESLARGEDALDMDKYRRCLHEREKLFELHPDNVGVDRFYHPYLTQTDLSGGITSAYLPQLSKAKKVFGATEIVNDEVIRNRIDRIDIDEWTHIKGYAFMEHPGNEKVSIVLVGKESFRFDTSPVFNHTYTHLFNDGKSYAFIGFETIFKHQLIPMDDYKIFIKIGQKMVETPKGIFLKDN